MEARSEGMVPSRNIMAEIVGSEFPDEVVVLGGHSDSWDVGQGAMDDAGGVVAAWEAVRLMKELGLRPRRTVRVVGWTAEEVGIFGGQAYAEAPGRRRETHVLGIESDGGCLLPPRFRLHRVRRGLRHRFRRSDDSWIPSAQAPSPGEGEERISGP